MPTNFPDIEKLVRNYLDINMAIPIAIRVPDPRPSQWVQVRRVPGGGKILVRDVANLEITTWDSLDEERAFTNACQARSLIHDLAGTATLGPMVYQVEEFSGLGHADDADSSDFIYLFGATLTVRAN